MFKFRPLLESLESRETPSPIGGEVGQTGEVQVGDQNPTPTQTNPSPTQVPTT